MKFINTKKIFLVLIISSLILNVSCFQFLSKTLNEPVKPQEIVIIHWNDFHAANLPYKPTYNNPNEIFVGGYANLAGYIDSLRGVYPGALVLNAGDDFQGSPVSSITKGMSQILILNQIKPTAFTIGNHEFDYGTDNLRKCIQKANFDILSANIFDVNQQKIFTDPYKIVQYGNAKVAIIGLVLDDLKSSVLPENVKGLDILDSYKQVSKYVDEVKGKSDLIIVLSHQGFFADSVLATRVPELDLIIGGHSHTWLREPVQVNNVLICQVGASGERLGLLKTKVDVQQDTILSFQYEFIRTELGKVKPNPDVGKVVDSLDAIIADKMNEIIGELKVDWIRNGRGESNIGNWICDVTREEFGTDIAYQNSGGIRKNLLSGPIKLRDIWEISPFDNTIVIAKISGKQLINLLQYRLDNTRDFLQFSGLRIKFSQSKNKIIDVTVNQKPIKEDQFYTIATNNYVIGHSARFWGIENDEMELKTTGVIGRDVLVKAIRKEKVISDETDGRYENIDK